MSRILPFMTPYMGLYNIVNVLDRVGPGQVNLHDEVKIVQQLLRMVLNDSPHRSYGFPQPAGHFDAVTGFWIFQVQLGIDKGGGMPQQAVDGIISPVRALISDLQECGRL